MRAITTEVTVLQRCEQLRLILVQFASPFEPENTELDFQSDISGARFRWKEHNHIATRVSRFWEMFAELKRKTLFGPAVTVVIFPEYAIPKECHNHLQEFADENNCIIVPGTYYEDDASGFQNNNVCTIYLPRQPNISIVKQHGFQDEQKALKVPSGANNIAHLLGCNEVLGDFSISVFICRDYLIPFETSGGNRILLSDWDRPGLNLVTMCSSHMELFEGQAAFDVRGLRGPRRVVGLCNCAGTGIEGETVVGTAILGPREDSNAEKGDVIENIRGDEEGVIVVDLLLNSKELGRVETKPGTQRFVPVKHGLTFKISSSGAHDLARESVELEEIRTPGVFERGVWHPALIEFVNRKIVMHLFRTRQFQRVKEALGDDKIHSVSVYAIEGIYDLLIRYYQSADTKLDFWEMYTYLSEEEFAELFIREPGGQIGSKIVIEPSDIIKYRTIPITSKTTNNREWTDRHRKIEELIPEPFYHSRRRERLRRISQLSQDWNDPKVSTAARLEVLPAFLDRREVVPSKAAIQTGRTNLRQKFILISVGTLDQAKLSQFEAEIINRQLLPLPEVRSIYRINAVLDSVRFDYWIDVIAESWRIGEIILRINLLANSLDLETGTRTMEVLEYYISNSVQGVHTTDYGREIGLFFGRSRRIEGTIASTSSADEVCAAYDFLSACAKGWNTQAFAPRGGEERFLNQKISEFYVYLFWGAVCREKERKVKYLRSAGSAWEDVYRVLENRFEDILKKYLRIDDEKMMWTRSTELLRKNGVNDKELSKIHTNPIEKVFHFATHVEDFQYLRKIDIKDARRIYKDKVVKFRNKMTHGDQRVTHLDIYRESPPKDGWNADEIIEISADLINMLNISSDCLDEINNES